MSTATPFERAQQRQNLANFREQQIAQVRQLRNQLADERELLAMERRKLHKTLLDGEGDLFAAVLRYEGMLIRKALERNKGHVSAAARELRVSHQSLSYIIRTRHSALTHLRTTPHQRRGKKQ